MRTAEPRARSSAGIVIAAPASASGKTTLTLALLRALRARGVAVASAKVGPDYIDPAYHAAASGRPCPNLDAWAMRAETFAGVVHGLSHDAELVIAEGVMGLFDGASGGQGSTADVSAATGWPVALVVDAGGMAASAAALVHGFASWRDDVRLAGVIFNRVGGGRHREILEAALAPTGVPVLGCVPRDPELELPDRHLGLVQAGEHPALEAFLDAAAGKVAAAVDVDALVAAARPGRLDPAPAPMPLPPLAQRVAVASDVAFAFSYPATLDGWRRAGAEVVPFSPLADEPPAADAGAVYLPGGYPELHAGRLAAAGRFLAGLREAAARGATVYGECGGYMVLGRGLTDAGGERHAMAGLLPVETSFAERRLTLGYRAARLEGGCALGAPGARFRGHEFHFARVLSEAPGDVLFRCRDASGRDLGGHGRRAGAVMGSFVHLVDRE